MEIEEVEGKIAGKAKEIVRNSKVDPQEITAIAKKLRNEMLQRAADMRVEDGMTRKRKYTEMEGMEAEIKELSREFYK